jgi:hypothetical protein
MAGNERQHGKPVIPPQHGKPGVGFEERDVNVSRVWASGAVVVLVCVFGLAGALGVFRYFRGGQTPPEGRIPVAERPPAPRLQQHERTDLKQMRADEDQILGSYGWVDRGNGIVRLPIDRAIYVLAQRGLPSRHTPGPETAAAGVSTPTESGLGPKMIQPGGPLATAVSK